MKYSVIGNPIENLFTNGDVDDNNNNNESSFNQLNHLNVFVRTENLVFYIDMMNIKSGEDQILFIADDFEKLEDDISEFNRNKYSNEIRRIIESHNTKWIPYQAGTSQNSNPFDTDDHTIESIERM